MNFFIVIAILNRILGQLKKMKLHRNEGGMKKRRVWMLWTTNCEFSVEGFQAFKIYCKIEALEILIFSLDSL